MTEKKKAPTFGGGGASTHCEVIVHHVAKVQQQGFKSAALGDGKTALPL